MSGTVNATAFTGNGAGLTNIAGDNIADNTVDSSEIQDGTVTADDLGVNSV